MDTSLSEPSTKDNSQSLVDIANNTFRELCETLENEQIKLLDLEERRKKLYDEIKLLRAEIEDERHIFKLNIMESVSENLGNLNKANESSSSTCSTMNKMQTEDPTETVEEFITSQRSKLEHLNKTLEACFDNESTISENEIGQIDTFSVDHSETMMIDLNEQRAYKLDNNVSDDFAMTEFIIDECLNINDSQLEVHNDEHNDSEKDNISNDSSDSNNTNTNSKFLNRE